MKRIKTGIHGLDELIEGGFPSGRTVLVSGACGCLLYTSPSPRD